MASVPRSILLLIYATVGTEKNIGKSGPTFAFLVFVARTRGCNVTIVHPRTASPHKRFLVGCSSPLVRSCNLEKGVSRLAQAIFCLVDEKETCPVPMPCVGVACSCRCWLGHVGQPRGARRLCLISLRLCVTMSVHPLPRSGRPAPRFLGPFAPFCPRVLFHRHRQGLVCYSDRGYFSYRNDQCFRIPGGQRVLERVPLHLLERQARARATRGVVYFSLSPLRDHVSFFLSFFCVVTVTQTAFLPTPPSLPALPYAHTPSTKGPPASISL